MQTKTIILLLINILYFDLIGLAQNIESISGTIQIESSTPDHSLAYGNAILLSPIDSSLLTGTSFWDGQFLIEAVNQPTVLLRLSSLEFEDRYLHLSYNGVSDLDLGIIQVETKRNQLDELVIAAEKPLTISRTDGSMEINIENTALSTSTSVDEILSRSPTVITNQEGDFEIVGKGIAVIYVNGRRVNNERLSTLSPSEIKSIQIISNPGPKYDAEGNAVIDIVTKGNWERGFNGILKNYYTVNDFAQNSNRSNLHLSAASNKWSMNGDYGLQLGNTRHILTTTRTRDTPTEYFQSNLKTDWQSNYDNYSNYSLGVQFAPKEESYVSVDYTGAYEKLGGVQASNNYITAAESGRYQSEVSLDRLDRKNTVNTNISFPIDSTSSIFIGNQYSNFDRKFDNLIENQTQVESDTDLSSIRNIGKNLTELISTQVDYQKNLGTSELEIGAKHWYVDVSAGTNFLDILDNETLQLNHDLSNSFTYTEKVSAGYLTFSGSLNQSIQYSVGLRVEHTNFSLESSSGEGVSIDRQYTNAFPSASLKRTLFDGFESFLTFSSRINRPSYAILNPFVIYQDQFTSIQGNSNIIPSKVYSLELGTIKNGWNMKLGYNHTLDMIQGGAFQSGDDSRVYVLRRYNMSRQREFLLSISKSIQVGAWQSVNTINATWSQLTDNQGVFATRRQQPFLYLYTQQKFDLLGLCKVYVTGSYSSVKQDGIYLRRSRGYLNTGIEKQFLKGKAKVNLEYNDIFYTIRADGEYQVGETFIVYANQYSSSYFRGAVTFNFGRDSKTKFRNKKVGESEIRRAG